MASTQIRPLDDFRYTLPIYRRAEAARLVGVSPSTLRNWAQGYVFKRLNGEQTVSAPLVTTEPPPHGQGPSVPFVGLAEAYILAAFRQAGVPMQRIRPAIKRLEETFGLAQALASERLCTDGAEVLWDYGRSSTEPSDQEFVDGLVVVRNGQGVFREVVKDYLTRVTYEDGWAKMIELPTYPDARVIVDPRINGGQPTLADRGIRVADVLDRLHAGESPEDLSYDYDLPLSVIESLSLRAA
jgi:uncharacterized protein (DUF433 family)